MNHHVRASRLPPKRFEYAKTESGEAIASRNFSFDILIRVPAIDYTRSMIGWFHCLRGTCGDAGRVDDIV